MLLHVSEWLVCAAVDWSYREHLCGRQSILGLQACDFIQRFVGTAVSACHWWTGRSRRSTDEWKAPSLMEIFFNKCLQPEGERCVLSSHISGFSMAADVWICSAFVLAISGISRAWGRAAAQTPPFNNTSVLFTVDTSSDNTDKAALWLFVRGQDIQDLHWWKNKLITYSTSFLI